MLVFLNRSLKWKSSRDRRRIYSVLFYFSLTCKPRQVCCQIIVIKTKWKPTTFDAQTETVKGNFWTFWIVFDIFLIFEIFARCYVYAFNFSPLVIHHYKLKQWSGLCLREHFSWNNHQKGDNVIVFSTPKSLLPKDMTKYNSLVKIMKYMICDIIHD